MATEISTLLRPLEGDATCGPDMSFSPEFDALRELRREDDPTLDQGEWVAELKRADWPGVLSACDSLLGRRSKDLRVAGWYTEAAAKLRGYAGLADGLALYTGLLATHWEGVHPQPDGTDQELRVGSINWLLTLLQEQARRIPVLREGERAFSLADIELARQRQQAGAQALAGQATLEDITRAQRKTPVADVAASLSQARRLPDALADLQAQVDARLGAEGPGFVATREAVADAVATLERLVRDMGGAPSTVLAMTPDAPADAKAQTPALPGALTMPANRAQALAQLRLVGEFFRRTEPHSPVAYLAERAAAWGEMPLHAWLRHVMKDGATLAQLEELLGVPPSTSAE